MSTVHLADPSILHPRSALRRFDYVRHRVTPQLAPFVAHFWTVTWDLDPAQTYTAETLPYAAVNLSVTDTEADVTGVVRRRYLRHLHGTGYAVGARFRPGGFRPWVGWPVSRLTDVHRPIAEVLGRSTVPLAARVAATTDLHERVALLGDFLAESCPAPDPTVDRLAEVVETILTTPSLTRVTDVARLAGSSVRTLQRDFAEYVGASPKWVIQRSRLQDAAARAAREPVDWSALAAELGFADQAHLTRAFTATVGMPPAAYARQG